MRPLNRFEWGLWAAVVAFVDVMVATAYAAVALFDTMPSLGRVVVVAVCIAWAALAVLARRAVVAWDRAHVALVSARAERHD